MFSAIVTFIIGAISWVIMHLETIIRFLKAVSILLNLIKNITSTMRRVLLKVDDLQTKNYSEYKVAAAIFDTDTKKVIDVEVIESNQVDFELKNQFGNKNMVLVNTN